jgi:3-dehydroquinate synthase
MDKASNKTITASFVMPYEYPVCFTRDAFSPENPELSRLLNLRHSHALVFVVIDQGIVESKPGIIDQIQQYFSHHKDQCRLASTPYLLEGGESAKKQAQIDALHQAMLKQHIDRHCVVLAIGGGAVLDAVGFACSTFHRGVPILRMPSTVLAQNDAGVGVKNGINAYCTKNLIGCFGPPLAVLNDSYLLETLSARDRRAGLAEAVKVATIRSADFFSWLESHAEKLAAFEALASEYAIEECARLHLRQITGAGDPFEQGSARPLDYGHWSAHRLEGLSQYQLRHGEAVAIGMALDALYAVEIEMLSESECNRLLSLLANLGFDLWHDTIELCSASGAWLLWVGLEEFREHLGGALCITLLTSMGQAVEVNHIDQSALQRAVSALKKRCVEQLQEQANLAKSICHAA